MFKIPAEAHADNHRRAGVSACILHNLQNKVYQIFFFRRRCEHLHLAHVFTAEAFGRGSDADFITADDAGVYDSGRVVLGVDAHKRVTHHGFAQKSLGVALCRAAVDRFFKITADNVYILPDFKEKHRHTRVLTYRNIQFLCRIQIV